MQTKNLCRVLASISCAIILLGCSPAADNPYSKLQDPPLVSASLHTVTVVSPDASLVEALQKQGFTPAPFLSNYPASVRVEALLWKVPEEAAASPVILMGPAGHGPDVRVLESPSIPAAQPVEPAVEEAFYRNVLGSDVPQWPFKLPAGARIQVTTWFVADVVAAKRRLREARIPVTFDPVDITTAYLGDHRVMGIQAPDGTVIELVQNVAQ
jgi:hypothetical protein